jgi:hypothetical protein
MTADPRVSANEDRLPENAFRELKARGGGDVSAHR